MTDHAAQPTPVPAPGVPVMPTTRPLTHTRTFASMQEAAVAAVLYNAGRPLPLWDITGALDEEYSEYDVTLAVLGLLRAGKVTEDMDSMPYLYALVNGGLDAPTGPALGEGQA